MLDGTGGLYLSHRRELYGHFQNGPVSRSPDGDNKPKLQFWRQKFEFLLSIVLHFNRVTFKTKICALVQNWGDYVCWGMEPQEPHF